MAAGKRGQVFKCEICGNVVEVLAAGGGELVCCGQPMKLLEEKTMDKGSEKHVPVVEKKGSGYLVKVGSVPHPMENSHYIQWIELIADNGTYRKYLEPGQKPEAEFCVKAGKVSAREHCNIHGLWRS